MNSKTFILLPCLFALLSFSVAAAELPTAPPEDVGMSAEKLALVKPTMQKFVDEKKVAGAIVIVARKGKVVLFDSVGWSDIDAKKPMKKDSILRFYSMSKAITSTAAMMLVEEGKIGLDDPVSKYIPELKGLKVYAGLDGNQMKLEDADREPTVRDLLRHTSGLTYGFMGLTPVDLQYRAVDILDREATLKEMAGKLSKIPLLYQPGTRFNYSVSVDVLGHVVERASGKKFGDFLAERIFKPLDMHDTAFYVDEKKVDRFTNCYGPKLIGGGLRLTDEVATSDYLKPPKFQSGGGGLVSTARDYMRFCQMIAAGGKLGDVRLLKEETVKQMTRNQLPQQAFPIQLGGSRDGVGFGLGFSVVVEKTEYTKDQHVGEYGWGGAASTHFWISPKDGLAVVVLSQYMPFSFQLESAVKPLIYDAIEE